MNIVITGNPGTGKTSFARLMFRFLRAHGILKRDAFVEKNALELKGRYIGQTAPNVIAAVAAAKGGCLFLDEAYALVDSGRGMDAGGDSFSREAIRTLLTEVENNRTGLMVVGIWPHVHVDGVAALVDDDQMQLRQYDFHGRIARHDFPLYQCHAG